MPTIALTGNFGMGKTTVLQLFEGLGADVVNIDDVVHVLLEKPSIARKIAGLLGDRVLSVKKGVPSLHKKRIAEIVFDDSEKRRGLEKILHPGALKEIKRIEAEILGHKPDAFIVFEIPLLFEAGYEQHFDFTVTVHTTRQTALRRLSKKGFSKDAALKRLRAQMSITGKKRLADFCIDNNDTIQHTKNQVQRILKKIKTSC